MLYNIIFIADDPAMLSQMSNEWKKYGGCLTKAETAQEAVSVLKNREYHLVKIIADHVQESLLASIKTMRDATDMPIVVMTSQYNSIDMIASLRCGADEYLVIPQTVEEVVMVGFAHVRRYCSFDCGRHDKKSVTYNDIHLDLRERKVKVGSKYVYLTRGEFECLNMLMSHPGRIFTYELLYYGAFGVEARSEDVISSVRSLIKRIRFKFGSEHARYVQAVHGIGFKIEKCSYHSE